MKKRNPKRCASRKYGSSRTRQFRRILVSFLSLGLFLSALNTLVTAQFQFDKHEIDIGPAKRQTVLTGFLLGGAVAELAVVNVDEIDSRLHIFSFDGDKWVQQLDRKMRPEVLFVDVANIDGHDRLLFYEQGRLSWFDPELAMESALAKVTAQFNVQDATGIPHVDVTRDLNGDGRDDLVIPGPDGFQILIQKNGGVFADPIKVGPPERFLDMTPFGAERTYGEIGWTAQTNALYQKRLHVIDYDRDGRTDLVFWNEDHFEVHRQEASNGSFKAGAESFTTEVAFDWDGTYSVMFRTGEEERLRVLHSFKDLNGDKIADLLVMSMKDVVSRGSYNRRRLARGARYEVYFGNAAPSGTVFSSVADTALKPRGMQVDLKIGDFDDDGRSDLMLTSFKLGVSSIFRVVVNRKTDFGLHFYRMEGGGYPGKPSARRKFTAGMDPFNDREESYFPFVLIGDVNGDNLSDLIIAKGRKEMHVFAGVAGPELFARKPQKLSVVIPIDEQYTWLIDLNKDGKQDIVMHHTSTEKPHRMTILIAR